MHLGFITDEVDRHLESALEIIAGWGLTRIELREGEQLRFPHLTVAEVAAVEEAVAGGMQVTAVSPGLFKGHVAAARRLRDEVDRQLHLSIELAQRVQAPVVILFGFAHDGKPNPANRVHVLRAFEQAGDAAHAAGLQIAIENEPNFWIDRPGGTVALLDELDHPAVQVNWDPANQHWGGLTPTLEDVKKLKPYLLNVHVKDYTPDDPKVPWRAVGEGTTPWDEILAWLTTETDLAHVTLETHCEPLLKNSRQSLAHVRKLLKAIA